MNYGFTLSYEKIVFLVRHENEFFTAKVSIPHLSTTSFEKKVFVNSHKDMLKFIKKHYKDPLKNGFPNLRDESKEALIYYRFISLRQKFKN